MAVDLGKLGPAPRHLLIPFSITAEQCFNKAERKKEEYQAIINKEMSKFVIYCESYITANIDKYVVIIPIDDELTRSFPNYPSYEEDVIKAAECAGFIFECYPQAEEPHYFISWEHAKKQ